MDEHVRTWSQGLTAARDLLAEGCDLFSSNSESVAQEVFRTEAGLTYLKCLIEVYKVASRIRTSLKTTSEELSQISTLSKRCFSAFQANEKLFDLFIQIDRSWNSLSRLASSSTTNIVLVSSLISSARAVKTWSPLPVFVYYTGPISIICNIWQSS